MNFVEITYRYDSDPPRDTARPLHAEDARRRLSDGNHAFASLLANLERGDGTARRVIQVDPRDLGLLASGASAPRQLPYAAVLGCSDARVPVELIFNEGPNDLFVVRVAGNVLGSDVLASLRYAVEHLGDSLKLVVVLGHSGCGAVTAAVDVFLNPADYLAMASKHVLRNLVDRLLVVVHAVAKRMASTLGPDVTQRPRYREALIEASIITNAALAAYTVQEQLGSSGAGALRAAYGVYLISTRTIWAPRTDGAQYAGLAEPPRDAESFAAFADSVLRSDRIVSLLDTAA